MISEPSNLEYPVIVLRDSTESLVATLGGANAHDWHVSYEQEVAGGGPVISKAASGQATAAAAFTLVAAPATGATRINSIHVRNTTANTTTIVFGTKISTTTRAITPLISLTSGQCATYESGSGWQIYLISGAKQAAA